MFGCRSSGDTTFIIDKIICVFQIKKIKGFKYSDTYAFVTSDGGEKMCKYTLH